jgi:hypothetical protein
MKLPIIRELAHGHTLEELVAAENALLEGKPTPFEVKGTDEGEMLTHLLGAQDVRKRMAAGADFNTALREFSQRVRNSIQ